MIGVNVICADTDEEAQRLATSAYQQFLNIIRGRTGQLSPPVDSMDDLWNLQEQAIVKRQLSFSAIGSPATVRAAGAVPAVNECGRNHCRGRHL